MNEYKNKTIEVEVPKSGFVGFDSVLKDVYRDVILELVTKQQSALLGMMDNVTWVQTKVTRWARFKARLRNLWYDARHALCCGVCKEEQW